MPKARKRKKGNKGAGQNRSVPSQRNANVQTLNAGQAAAKTDRAFLSPPVRGAQSLVWPLLVSLGCWGLTASFVFFSSDPNHFLFGGMAALMAVLWSFSFGVRARKVLQGRVSARA